MVAARQRWSTRQVANHHLVDQNFRKPETTQYIKSVRLTAQIPLHSSTALYQCTYTRTNTWNTSSPPWGLSFQDEFVDNFKLMENN